MTLVSCFLFAIRIVLHRNVFEYLDIFLSNHKATSSVKIMHIFLYYTHLSKVCILLFFKCFFKAWKDMK